MLKNDYKLSEEEKKSILFHILAEEVGYKKACDLYDKAKEAYNPIEYAVKYALNQLETRDAVHNKTQNKSTK